jgi:hypothetical protein
LLVTGARWAERFHDWTAALAGLAVLKGNAMNREQRRKRIEELQLLITDSESELSMLLSEEDQDDEESKEP